MAHTAVGSERVVTQSVSRETQRNAGSRLRERFGHGYRSIGLTFGDDAMPFGVARTACGLRRARAVRCGICRRICSTCARQHRPGAPLARRPAKTRLIGPDYDPHNDAAYHLSGQSLAAWFGAVVHIPTVTPQQRITD